jgi:hypothetical protein
VNFTRENCESVTANFLDRIKSSQQARGGYLNGILFTRKSDIILRVYISFFVFVYKNKMFIFANLKKALFLGHLLHIPRISVTY